jgi:hypothetical protein
MSHIFNTFLLNAFNYIHMTVFFYTHPINFIKMYTVREHFNVLT